MGKSLYLHIGHGKTGSSYIQSSLAGSIPILRDRGFYYPVIGAEDAAKGRISSGNSWIFRDLVTNGGVERPLERSFLASGEVISGWLRKEVFQEKFLSFLADQNVTELKVLLFIRDPVSHACSSYQQGVKRAGNHAPIDELFNAFAGPTLVDRVLAFLEQISFCTVTVKNYSRCRDDVLPIVESWLGVPRGALAIPPIGVVNRSLTASELLLQQHVNRQIGPSGAVLSDVLCNALPDVRADEVRPSVAVQEALWTSQKSAIARVNSRIEPAERYDRSRDVSEPSTPDDLFSFNEAQIKVIAECLARQTGLAREATKLLAESKANLSTAEARITAMESSLKEKSGIETRLHAAETRITAMESSTSWRLTLPLRRARRMLMAITSIFKRTRIAPS